MVGELVGIEAFTLVFEVKGRKKSTRKLKAIEKERKERLLDMIPETIRVNLSEFLRKTS